MDKFVVMQKVEVALGIRISNFDSMENVWSHYCISSNVEEEVILLSLVDRRIKIKMFY